MCILEFTYVVASRTCSALRILLPISEQFELHVLYTLICNRFYRQKLFKIKNRYSILKNNNFENYILTLYNSIRN